MGNLLTIRDLHTNFLIHAGKVQAIRGVDIDLDQGEALGIVGESGSGKSVTMLSVMHLLDDNGRVDEGSIEFDGKDITHLSDNGMRKIRGNDIGMIFQDPMTSLNPVYPIGTQLMEPLLEHRRVSKATARKEAIEMMKKVGIPSPEKRLKQYPHEFSGGMRQRVMIAMALICGPKLIIADEPTTALDVTIQAQILELMKRLREETGTSIILITHDLGVVADVCSRINVMYGGVLVEKGSTDDIFYRPRHPYTLGLLQSVPNPQSATKEKLIPIEGTPPDLIKPPLGCPFAARCSRVMKLCLTHRPPLFPVGPGHEAACWLNHEKAPKTEWIGGEHHG
ncbi:Oligopeptide transport ATP-binding protein OppD [Clostridiaceae bacterium JG1575]|nr:Oligopeptide transport ATP-binding protein OppD [Clostridiaceae bacterium JG1575]